MLKFSIITVVFNDKIGLKRTIESVINQSYKDYEYIIIDGGSTDGTVDVIKEYADRITYWVSEPDKGIYNAMNKGIKVAQGQYCNFMNAGDMFVANDVLEKTSRYADGTSVLTGDTQACHLENGEVVKDGMWPSPNKLIGYKLIHMNGALSHQASFILTELLKSNPYNEKFKICSDWQFFVEELVMKDGTYLKLPFIVALFDGNGISNQRNRSTILKEKKNILNLVLPKRICEDYEQLIYGETPLEKIIKLKGESSLIYKTLTRMALVYMEAEKLVKKFVRYKK